MLKSRDDSSHSAQCKYQANSYTAVLENNEEKKICTCSIQMQISPKYLWFICNVLSLGIWNPEGRRQAHSSRLWQLSLAFFFPFNSTSFQGCSTVNQFPAYLLTQSQNTSLNTYLRKVRKGSLKVEPVPSYLIVQDEENDDAHWTLGRRVNRSAREPGSTHKRGFCLFQIL